MRVVVDTNVWVSRLLLSGSVAALALDKALGSSEVMVSESLVAELANVLSREKFDRYVPVQDREEFLRRVPKVAIAAPVLTEVDVCRAPTTTRCWHWPWTPGATTSLRATATCWCCIHGEG